MKPSRRKRKAENAQRRRYREIACRVDCGHFSECCHDVWRASMSLRKRGRYPFDRASMAWLKVHDRIT